MASVHKLRALLEFPHIEANLEQRGPGLTKTRLKRLSIEPQPWQASPGCGEVLRVEFLDGLGPTVEVALPSLRYRTKTYFPSNDAASGTAHWTKNSLAPPDIVLAERVEPAQGPILQKDQMERAYRQSKLQPV